MSRAVQRRRGGGEEASEAPACSASKVAYDPEEERRTSSVTTRPVLTLMEEVLLLGLKDEQGLLSFWNDSLSYVLRGCILLELALQGKIAVVNVPQRKQYSLSERKLEVTNDTLTGEVLLDETIKLMKETEPMSASDWMDALSGETWSISKIGLHLKQVRERLSKGLVDKGICRTEKMSFILFDMATHPVVDFSAKAEIRARVFKLLNATTYTPEYPDTHYFPSSLPLKTLRTVALAVSSYAANVLENLYASSSYDARDAAYLKVDELLADYSEFPFASQSKSTWGTSIFRSIVQDITEAEKSGEQLDLRLEVIAAVFRRFLQLDEVL